MTLLLLSKLSKKAIYLPDIEKESFNQHISLISRSYVIKREEFQSVTGIKSNHLAREINKVREGLGTKVINTPHPLDKKNIHSGETIPWFSKISFLDSYGVMTFKFNDEAIKRLAAFVKYSKIKFEYISLLKNHNALFSYIFFKILKDSSRYNDFVIDVSDFKERLGLATKYVKIKQFKDKVLDVITKEINEFTDLNIDYELIKEGRSFSKIKFTFDYKSENLEEKSKEKVKKLALPQ